MKRISHFLALATLLSACLPVLAARADDEKPITKTPEKPRLECWVDLYRGDPVSYRAMLGDLATARVIYVGESHLLPRHHAIQAGIVRDLAKRDVPLVLALEQIEATYQFELDLYNEGILDFDELAVAIDWENRWRGFEHYREALEAAREAGAPVLALNAPKETIRQVARSGGVDRLDETTRKELPKIIQLDDPPYRQLLNLRLKVHMAATAERLRPMIEAQIARDEHMAQTLADFLKSEEGKGRTAVVLCGGMHCNFGLGTVSRVRRRLPGVNDRIVMMTTSGDAKATRSMKAMSRPVTITHEQLRQIDRPIGDYLHVISRKK